jgi:hypothetical protein
MKILKVYTTSSNTPEYISKQWSEAGSVSRNGFVSAVWGPPMWSLIHVGSMGVHTTYSAIRYAQWLSYMRHVLPCRACRENFSVNVHRTLLDIAEESQRYIVSKDTHGAVANVEDVYALSCTYNGHIRPPRRVAVDHGWSKNIYRALEYACIASDGIGSAFFAHRLHSCVRSGFKKSGNDRGCAEDLTFEHAMHKYHVEHNITNIATVDDIHADSLLGNAGWRIDVTAENKTNVPHGEETSNRSTYHKYANIVDLHISEHGESTQLDFLQCYDDTIHPYETCVWLCIYIVCMNFPIYNLSASDYHTRRERSYDAWMIITLQTMFPVDFICIYDGLPHTSCMSLEMLNKVESTRPGIRLPLCIARDVGFVGWSNSHVTGTMTRTMYVNTLCRFHDALYISRCGIVRTKKQQSSHEHECPTIDRRCNAFKTLIDQIERLRAHTCTDNGIIEGTCAASCRLFCSVSTPRDPSHAQYTQCGVFCPDSIIS